MPHLGLGELLKAFDIAEAADYYLLPPGRQSVFVSRLYSELAEHAQRGLKSIQSAPGVKLHFVVDAAGGEGPSNLPDDVFFRKICFYASKTLVTFPFRETERSPRTVIHRGYDTWVERDKEVIAFGKYRAQRDGYGGDIKEVRKNHHLLRSEFDSFLHLLCSARPFLDSGDLTLLPSYQPEAKQLSIRTKAGLGLIRANFQLPELRRQFEEEGLDDLQLGAGKPPYLYLPYFTNLSARDVLALRQQESGLYNEFQSHLKALLYGLPQAESERALLRRLEEIDQQVRSLAKSYEAIRDAARKRNLSYLLGFVAIGLVPLIPAGLVTPLAALLGVGSLSGFKYIGERKEKAPAKLLLKQDEVFLLWRLRTLEKSLARKRPRTRSIPNRPLPQQLPSLEARPEGGFLGSVAEAAPGSDPPRTAYSRFDAPEVAVAGVEMEVIVGLAAKPSPGVVGGPLSRPDTSVGPYTLTIQLVADGFRLRDGETLRRAVPVTAEESYPTTVFHLTPEAQTEAVRARFLQAFYEVEGQTIGMAVRPVAVVLRPELKAGVPKPAGAAGLDLALQANRVAADLEIRILLDADHPGRLLWTFTSPHAGAPLPDRALPSEVGEGLEVKAFARSIIDQVNHREGKAGVYNTLAGIGTKIARQMPDEIWGLLRAVGGFAKDGIPNVLILSQEPYVPWELARIYEPLLDPEAPPFLAAQANVGRWVLPRQVSGSDQRPRQPPPTEVQVNSVAVISGVYDRPGWNRLVEAEGEADDLHQSYGATKVGASTTEVLRCLEGDPSADLLHFAVHGIYDPGSIQNGLMLTDGEMLSPYDVAGSELRKAPFVFLNACQVGVGNQVLGDYSGLAAEFLSAGASAVVAPLWSIKDTVAREIASAFYSATAAGAASPAAALRGARKAFKAGQAPQSATCLAYQYFGHPALKLLFSGRNRP